MYMYASVFGGFQFHTVNTPTYDGPRDFNVGSAKEALFRLRDLKEKGIRIPDYAFERLEEEYLDLLKEQQETKEQDG